MQTRSLVSLLASAALLTGCHKKPVPRQANLAQVLPNIPLPPDPQPLVRETGTDAMQILVVSSASADSVVAYYRQILSTDPFHLVNERKSGATTEFYAEQNGPSIWITVSPNGGQGSQVLIAGAKDTTAAKAP